VMFADCPTPTQCPENQTWTYNGTAWTNLTGSLTLSPSAREGAGFDYDPQLGGVVLFGGSNGVNATFNDTWLFTATGWANITLTAGIPEPLGVPPAIPGWAWGGMTWDPALNGIVIVDGCVTYSCNDVWGQTWLLTGGLWTYQGWGPATTTNGTYLGYNSVAYDAADGYLVAFGGLDYFADTSLNDTFTMNSSGVWVNITSHDAGCVASVCYTPQGRDSAAMTWDGQLGAVFLTGGFNETTAFWLNDSWTFAHGAWLPANLTAPTAPSGYCGVAEPAMPEWSDNIAPFIIGGNGLCGASAFTKEWVYEVPPQPSVRVSPNPVDVDLSTTVNAGWTVGTGSGIVAGWNVSFGDGIYDSPARNHTLLSGLEINTSLAYSTAWPHSYATPGPFTVNVTWSDFFYISGKVSNSATVDAALAANITTSATSITAGGTVTFSTSPTGGSGTYTYAWEFGDGNTSTVEAPPAHTYPRAGSYTVNLTVTDGAGGDVKRSVTITVASAPVHKNKASVSPFETYLIVGIVVAVLVVLAVALLLRRRKPSGAPAPWQSGAPPPAGATGGVPPGAGGSMPPPPPPPP
jgi:PKD repeat protein